jgi:hypothetical protein
MRGARKLTIALGVICGSCWMAGVAPAEPPGRVYEMVSPAFKAGYGIGKIEAVAPDGQSAVFASLGAFAGDPAMNLLSNVYMARRSELSGHEGWSIQPLNAPAPVWPYSLTFDYSPDLTSSVTYAVPGPNDGTTYVSNEVEYLRMEVSLPDIATNFEIVGSPLVLTRHTKAFELNYAMANPEMTQVVFVTEPGQNLVPQASNTESRLYEISKSGLRLVGLNNKDKVMTTCILASIGAEAGRGSWLNADASDGEAIFFMLGGVANGDSTACNEHQQVFVRLGGLRTLEVSRPLNTSARFGGCVGENGVPGEVPCVGAVVRRSAEYQGASEDGSRVFFASPEPLSNSDHDTGNDIYMATIECPGGGLTSCAAPEREVTSLTQTSRGVEPADVQNVIAIARDGSRVYFVAHGALTGPNGQGTRPVKGSDNLYVANIDSHEEVAFIGRLCSGRGLSGEVPDLQCPSGSSADDSELWESLQPQAQLNECPAENSSCERGRFLVFATYAQFSNTDTDVTKDVYRYDADTGVLQRVSAGEDGYNADGNAGIANSTIDAVVERGGVAEQRGLRSRNITEDGSRGIFFSSESLSAKAVNGLTNVYEWHEGADGGIEVQLVSTGNSDAPVDKAVISSTGEDIFFLTPQRLTGEDPDELMDLYDARVGGGLPTPSSPLQACNGDGCQGPLTTLPPQVPASASVIPGDDYKLSNCKKRMSKRNLNRKHKGRRISSKRRHGARHHAQKRGRTGCR